MQRLFKFINILSIYSIFVILNNYIKKCHLFIRDSMKALNTPQKQLIIYKASLTVQMIKN